MTDDHPATAAAPLLSVRDLRVAFPSRRGVFEAVRGVSFDLGRERLRFKADLAVFARLKP